MLLSPCVGVCEREIDPRTGRESCPGCGRTGPEIDGWSKLEATERDAVWRDLPGRLDAIGARVRRPRWELADLRPALEAAAAGGGVWRIGDAATGASFALGPDAVSREGAKGAEGAESAESAESEWIYARADGARLRLRPDRRTRTFQIFADGAGRALEAIALTVFRGRAVEAAEPLGTVIGPDPDPIEPDRGAAALFDLGVAAPGVRAYLRPRSAAAEAAIRALGPPSARAALAALQADRAALDVVVDAGLARIETPLARVALDAEVGGGVDREGGGGVGGDRIALSLGGAAQPETTARPEARLSETYAPLAVFTPPAPV